MLNCKALLAGTFFTCLISIGVQADTTQSRKPASNPYCEELAQRAARSVESESTEFKRDYFSYRITTLEEQADTYQIQLRPGTPSENHAHSSYKVVTSPQPNRGCKIVTITKQ